MMSAYRRRWSDHGVSRAVLLELFKIAGIPVVREAEGQTSPHAIERGDEFDLHYMVCGEDVCHFSFDPLLRDHDLELLLQLLNLDWQWLDNHDPYSWVLIHSDLGPVVSRGWNLKRAIVAGIFQFAAMRQKYEQDMIPTTIIKDARVREFQKRFTNEFAFDPRN